MAALGSYLDARRHGGTWLVRMEDIDPLRTRPGAADEILATLESFALHWDGAVLYQSRRTGLYQDTLATLTARGLTFPCSCSRRELAQESTQAGDGVPAGVYPGTCRAGPARPGGPTSTRFRVDCALTIGFEDGLQGPQALPLSDLGDVIVRRRDGVFAYQLAVVADDAAQGVTHVVRGADLLESTGWQIALQQALTLPTPRYSHLPIVLDRDGQKLSKSRRSLAAAPDSPGGPAARQAQLSAQLATALCLLRLAPAPDLAGAPPHELLAWAIPRWPPAGLRGVLQLPAPD